MKLTLSSLLIGGWILFSACTPTPPPQLSRLGTTPLSDVYVFDNHKKSYDLWQEKGITDAILLHIDTHLDFNWLSEKDLTMIDQKEPYGSPHNLVMTLDNYIYPAVKKGMIKKIYWLVPDRDWPDEPTMLTWLKSNFNQHQIHITIDDIKSFQRQGKVYQGRLYQTDLVICNLENLPAFKQEVLIDLDLDYFFFDSFYFTKGRLPLSTALFRFLEELTAKNIPAKMAFIATSSHGGYTPTAYRFWGEAIKQFWQDPKQSDKQFWQIFQLQNSALLAFIDQDYPRAEQIINQALKLDSNNGGLFYLKSEIKKAQGDNEEGKKAFNRAYQLDPFFQRAPLHEAHYAVNQEQPVVAYQLYQDYLSMEANDPVALVELGDLLLAMGGEGREAQQYATKAREIDKNYGNAHMLIGNILQTMPNIDPRLSFMAYMQAKSLGPEWMNFSLIEGDYHAAQHQYELAEKAFSDACAKGPQYDIAYSSLGFFYANGGHGKKALVSFEKALMFNPENPDATFNLAQLYLETGETEKGRRLLEKASSLMPDNQMIKKMLDELP